MICHHVDIYATIGTIYEFVKNDRLKDLYFFRMHQYLIQYEILADLVIFLQLCDFCLNVTK